ncbi:MAG: hypothetical protein K2O09_06060, partial [Treponemataceae bacterium]|nr:hypothetical protein [Treponemataceae bacterium]
SASVSFTSWIISRNREPKALCLISSEVTGVSGLSDAGWRETTGGFDIDVGVGVTFNVTEKIGVLADFTGFFGTSNGFSFTVGASYRFK